MNKPKSMLCKRLKEVMLQIPFSMIKKIEAVAQSGPEYISLSQGAIRVGGIPNAIKAHLQQILNTDATDYYSSCWGIAPLRQALADHASTLTGKVIKPINIIATHGCIGGLSLLYLGLLEAGDEVIIPEPAYPAYDILAATARAKAVHVSCHVPSQNGDVQWHLDIDVIKAAVTARTKMIIFSNPNNPLGLVVPGHVIADLLTWCEQRGIYLVVDEAYRDYVFSGDYTSSMGLVPQSEFLISAQTFSKNMAMSGWRIGYLVVPEKLAHSLAHVQDALLNCLNNTAQHAAMYALQHPEIASHFASLVLANRDRAITQLAPLIQDHGWRMSTPAGGFFLFIKVDSTDATDLCMELLNNAKVGLIPGKGFGPTGAPFLRLCFARDPQVLHEGINRIITYMQQR